MFSYVMPSKGRQNVANVISYLLFRYNLRRQADFQFYKKHDIEILYAFHCISAHIYSMMVEMKKKRRSYIKEEIKMLAYSHNNSDKVVHKNTTSLCIREKE